MPGDNVFQLPIESGREQGYCQDPSGVWVVPESIAGLPSYSPEAMIAFLEHLSDGGTNKDWSEMARQRGWADHKTIYGQWARHSLVNKALMDAQQYRLISLEDECLTVSRHRERGTQSHETMETAANHDGTVMEAAPVIVKKTKKSQDDSPNSRRVHLTGVLKAVEAAKTSATLFMLRTAHRALFADGQPTDDGFRRETRRAVAELAIEIANSTLDTRERIVAGHLALKAIGVEAEGDVPQDILSYTFDTSGDTPATTTPEDLDADSDSDSD